MKTVMYGIRKKGDTGLPCTFTVDSFDESSVTYRLSDRHYSLEQLYLLVKKEEAQFVLASKRIGYGSYGDPVRSFDYSDYEVVEVELNINS